jgi:hypothetical protein
MSPTVPRAGTARASTASRGPKHAPRVPFALLVTALVVGGMCALLGLNTASAANELSRHNLAVKDADIAGQVQELRNEVAASAAPGALGSAAAALGMVPAGNPAFLQIGANGRVRVLGSPAPVSAAAAPRPVVTTPTTPTTHTSGPTKPGGIKATSTATSTATSKKTGATKTGTTPTPTAQPTPTPTPTSTLPGGPR